MKNNSHAIVNRHSYLYNTAGQRTKQTRTDSSYVNYTYDPIGQLQSALGYTSGGAPLSTEQNGYTYDAAWNLKARTNNAAVTSFGVNLKNELTTEPNGTAVYDSNGNPTSDGVRNFAYDDENQLASAYVNSSWKVDFQYDGLSRMRKRIEYSWSGAAWTPTSETRYVYDGRRVIQERNSSDVPQVAYTRGNDLSGSFEGAGGIGGLLLRASGYSAGSWSTHNHYHADGVGNITALVDSSTQLPTASYRYNAYGNLLSSSGTMASANTYRFSSKEIIASAGIYYYGFRFYEPNFQRWLNQDPLGEEGGINLYNLLANRPLNSVDPFGRQSFDSPSTCGAQNPELAKFASDFTREANRDFFQKMAERKAAENALRMGRSAANKALRQALGTGEEQVAHHGVPFAQRFHPLVEKAAQGRWNLNAASNGRNLPKAFHRGFPKWHRDYKRFGRSNAE